ncbi:fimbrial protein [Escherichia coli]|nr:fimbrial protein [Escherichia coli]
MGKTFSIKVLFGIYLLLMAGKVFAFSCNVDGGSSIGAGTTSVYVNLDPVILPGQNLVVDLSQHISCWNDYGGWYATKASGVGVSLMRNGKTLATGENVSLGTVNKSKVPLGLSATYGQTGNKVAAGAVQSVIGVTFIYE